MSGISCEEEENKLMLTIMSWGNAKEWTKFGNWGGGYTEVAVLMASWAETAASVAGNFATWDLGSIIGGAFLLEQILLQFFIFSVSICNEIHPIACFLLIRLAKVQYYESVNLKLMNGSLKLNKFRIFSLQRSLVLLDLHLFQRREMIMTYSVVRFIRKRCRMYIPSLLSL